MKSFYIITNKKRDRDMSVTERTRAFLCDNGCSVTLADTEKEDGGHYVQSGDVPGDTDCVITIGGDGTLIAAARDTADLDIPILGINQGSLGFLTEVEVDNIENALGKVINGQYEIEERMMLCGKVFGTDGNLKAEARALNDIVLHNMVLKISDYGLSVNSKFLSGFKSDGMIVCTPTGSTAYSMSAGGPIIEPTARMMAVTPICPHTLNTRSIVISAENTVEVSVNDDNSSVLFDGHFPCRLKKGDIVNVRPSNRVTRIIRIAEDSFLDVLGKKFRS